MDDSNAATQGTGVTFGRFHSPRIGRDDDDISAQFALNVAAKNWCGNQVVERAVKEALNLSGM